MKAEILKHRRLIIIGGICCALNLLIVAGLFANVLRDIWFMILAATAPWSLAMLGIGLSRPNEQATFEPEVMPKFSKSEGPLADTQD